jgi:hypothetical protein
VIITVKPPPREVVDFRVCAAAVASAVRLIHGRLSRVAGVVENAKSLLLGV